MRNLQCWKNTTHYFIVHLGRERVLVGDQGTTLGCQVSNPGWLHGKKKKKSYPLSHLSNPGKPTLVMKVISSSDISHWTKWERVKEGTNDITHAKQAAVPEPYPEESDLKLNAPLLLTRVIHFWISENDLIFIICISVKKILVVL